MLYRRPGSSSGIGLGVARVGELVALWSRRAEPGWTEPRCWRKRRHMKCSRPQRSNGAHPRVGEAGWPQHRPLLAEPSSAAQAKPRAPTAAPSFLPRCSLSSLSRRCRWIRFLPPRGGAHRCSHRRRDGPRQPATSSPVPRAGPCRSPGLATQNARLVSGSRVAHWP